MSIDQTNHSLFGASKTAADILGPGIRSAILRNAHGLFPRRLPNRGGHTGTELHGFLAYLMNCTVTGDLIGSSRAKGKQVRDNYPHARSSCKLAAIRESRKPSEGKAYNMGGSRYRNCSMLDVRSIVREIAGTLPMN